MERPEKRCTIRHVLVIALQDEGYEVRQAVNGQQALDATATYAACAATIAKPFDLGELLDTLARIIAARRAPQPSRLEA